MRLVFLIFAVLALGMPSIGYSQSVGDSEWRVQNLARRAYSARKNGRFEDAVALYLEAYQLRGVPSLLYNIAYIYDRDIKDLELAQRFYRRCIAADGVQPDVARRANARLRIVRGELESKRIRTSERTRVLVVPEPTGIQRTVQPPRVSADSKPWWCFGAGVVVLLGGGIVGGMATYNARQFRESTLPDEKQEIRELAQTQALTADILLGTGASLALVGLVWSAFQDDEPSTAVNIGFGVDYFGPAVGGSF